MLTLFEKGNAGKPIVLVPEVCAGNSSLVVKVAVNVEGIIGKDLKTSQLLTWLCSVGQCWFVLAAPGTAVGVAVAVVVACEVLLTGLLAGLDTQWLVDGRKKVLSKRRRNLA